MESIDIDPEICNCKLYHAPVFLEHCSHSSTVVMLFLADDSEDPLGLEMPEAICSVAYPEHSLELFSWQYGTCCGCKTDLCQQIHGAYFVLLRKKDDTFWVPLTFTDTDSYLRCKKTFNARRQNITVNG